MQRKRVFYGQVSSSDIKKFVKDGRPPRMTNVMLDPKLSDFKLSTLKDEKENIQFFFMGDLIHTVLDCMYEPGKNGFEVFNPEILPITTGRIRKELNNVKKVFFFLFG